MNGRYGRRCRIKIKRYLNMCNMQLNYMSKRFDRRTENIELCLRDDYSTVIVTVISRVIYTNQRHVYFQCVVYKYTTTTTKQRRKTDPQTQVPV